MHTPAASLLRFMSPSPSFRSEPITALESEKSAPKFKHGIFPPFAVTSRILANGPKNFGVSRIAEDRFVEPTFCSGNMGLCGSSTDDDTAAGDQLPAGNQPLDLSNVDISQLTDEQIEAIELGFFQRIKRVDTTRDVNGRVCFCGRVRVVDIFASDRLLSRSTPSSWT
jgi:hypothetical protein